MKKLILLALAATSLALAQNKKIVAQGISDQLVNELKSSVPNVTIVQARGEQFAKEIVEADAVIGAIRPEHLRAAKKLKWVHVTSAGVEHALFPELVKSDIVVTNAKNVYGPQIADHAFAFLLALTRRLNLTIPAQVNEEWPRGREGMFELNGKTAVIIGVGGIGSNIAQRAHGFGMRVIGVDPRDITPGNIVQRLVPPDRLNEVLPEADVVFISAPHTRKSEKMMGPQQFELMKQGSYFIAMSRGKVYDMPSLVKALDSGKLAGAGVDVTDPEPLPKGHPLWKFKNVVITPHSSGGSDNLQQRLNFVVGENIRRFASGRPLINVVNKQEGY
ncbi:MAG: D-2-hydroxyacid dehydrogenase [Acidobacteria bacterium]|nr:D-2-hydroxyacid dehydrogenase [Acidobacteriota bacterium]MBI3281466.1 D-2-hydroxyacid dehydrogenase [Acidobacteriota bacterium]